MPRSPRTLFAAAARAWNAIEQSALALLVMGIVVLAAAQIILRNFFKTGLPWSEPVLGLSLLWLTLLGALAATGAGRHISIDLASHLFPPRARRAAAALVNLFAAVVCGFLAHAAIRFCAFQREMATPGALGVPAWKLYLVAPVCFALMALRFAAKAERDAAGGMGRGKGREAR